MAKSDDKARLLRSLAIDRSATNAARAIPWRWLLPVVLGGGAAAALVIIAALLQRSAADRLSERTAASQQPAQTAPQASAPVVDPRRTGGLAASGYVVARRKATVAAEITGKVVVVLVEEGMIVREGQELARLDSVLAEQDLALAKSRIESAEAAIAVISADLEDALRIVARAKTLAQRNVTSEADLTKAEARAGVLNAQLRQYQAQFETARLDAQRNAAVLDKHSIRAPFDGVV